MSGQKGAKADRVYEFEIVYKVGASNIIEDALSRWHVDKEMWAIKTLLARHCRDPWRVKEDLVLTKIVEILIIQIHSHAMIVYSRAGSPWVPKFLHEFHAFPTGNIWVFLKNLYKNGNIDFLIGMKGTITEYVVLPI